MLKFSHLAVACGPYFEAAELDLSYEGITVLTGHNLDNGPGASNESGKSYLVNQISNLLYGSSPIIEKNQKQSEKSAFDRKDAAAAIEFEMNGKVYCVEKYAKGKSIGMDIYEDDADLGFSTTTAAKEWLEGSLPINQDFFYSSSHLIGRRASQFIDATPRQTFDYLSRLFSLDTLDKIRDSIKAEKSTISKELISIDERKKLLDDLNYRIENLYTEASDVELDDTDYENCDGIHQCIEALQDSINWYKDAQDYYNKACNVIGIQAKFEELSESLGIDTSRHANEGSIRVNSSQLHQRKQTVEGVISILNKENNLFSELSSLAKDEKFIFLEKQIDEHASKAKGNDTFKQEEKVNKEIFAIKEEEKQKNKIIQWILESSDKACPTCGRPMDDHEAHETNNVLSFRLDQLMKERQSKESWSKILKDYNDFLMRIEDIVAELKIPEESMNGDFISYAKNRMQENDEDLEIKHKELDELKVEIALADEMGDFEYTKRRMNELDMPVSEAQDAVKEFEDIDFDAVNTALNKKLLLLNSIAELESQEKELKKSADNNDLKEQGELLDVLIAACGADGLRRLKCESIMEHICNVLNCNSNLVFPSSKEFSYITSAMGIEMLCNGRSLRELSGAASQLFTVLVTVALLELIDDSRRTNLLVLDEMDVFMDDPAKHRFYDELLPLISSVVPHVIVVTPLPPEWLNGANSDYGFRQAVVVRENNTSRLEM